MRTEKPKVSIIVPFRNESKNIDRFFRGIKGLTYPEHLIQIILGNDDSSDDTLEILSKYASKFENILIVDIPISYINGSQTHKMRALSYLEQYIDSDYAFFTDADILVPKNWIQCMLTGFVESNKTGVVVGCTGVENSGLLSRLQNLEWLNVLRLMHQLGKKKIPSTGMGNNMAINTQIYKEIGGFKGLDFSIVEDYAIYKKIIKNNYSFNHLFNNEVLAATLAPDNYFEQRKRWAQGSLSSDSPLKVLAVSQALFLPFLICLSFISWKLSLLLLVIYSFIFLFVSAKTIFKLGLKLDFKSFLLFPFYLIISMPFQYLNHFFNSEIIITLF
jgi:cellulose synthase/poly-beta-1,6-N-acetylglucosamine synthase-like glycosyltransferase